MTNWNQTCHSTFNEVMGCSVIEFTMDRQGGDELAALVSLPELGPENYFMDGEISKEQARSHWGQKLATICIRYGIDLNELAQYPHIQRYFAL